MTQKRLIVFRTDSSVGIGTGHIMRCLTLAKELHSKGCTVAFICRQLAGNIVELVTRQGYTVFYLDDAGEDWDWKIDALKTAKVLEQEGYKPDWLIVDHYGLDYRWERYLRPLAKKILVIDDLANRQHDCDILLDQNIYPDMEQRYKMLVPKHCKLLLGPKNALLRKEFRDARNRSGLRDGSIRRILICFGGSDPTGETVRALKAVQGLAGRNFAIDVVIGQANPHQDEIEFLCSNMTNTALYYQADNMAELMSVSDLALGAGGTMTWERCCLGLPTIVIAIAENQESIASYCAKEGVISYLGLSSFVTIQTIIDALRCLLNNPDLLINMSEKAASLVDGNGVFRVTSNLMP